MSDKIYVKHSLGNFQQPYLHQVATNNQNTSTGTTQGTTRGNTQQPSTYQNQGTTVVQQPVNVQTARQGSTQQPNTYIYQSPSIGNTRANVRYPFEYNFTYQHSQPYPFIQPYIFQTATRYPYITFAQGNTQETNTGSTQQPSIGTTQYPFTYPHIVRYPFTYPFNVQNTAQGSTQGTTDATGNTRGSTNYNIQTAVQQPSIGQGNTRGTTAYPFRSPSRYSFDVQNTSQGTTSYPFRTPSRYPFTYDYGVSTPGDTDIPINLEEKMFLITPTLHNIRSIDLFSTTSTASQMRQDNFHFKTEIDTTNFSGKTVFRIYIRGATTSSPDLQQGSQNGTKSAVYETTHGESGIATGSTIFSTSFIELARYQVPSSYTGLTGYKTELSNVTTSANNNSVITGWLEHTDPVVNQNTKAFPTNNLVTYYNNCLSFKTFETAYQPAGFQLRMNSLGPTSASWQSTCEIQIGVKLRSTSPSPTRTFTAGTNIRLRVTHDVTFIGGGPPTPAGPQFPGGGPGLPTPTQQPSPPVGV